MEVIVVIGPFTCVIRGDVLARDDVFWCVLVAVCERGFSAGLNIFRCPRVRFLRVLDASQGHKIAVHLVPRRGTRNMINVVTLHEHFHLEISNKAGKFPKIGFADLHGRNET